MVRANTVLLSLALIASITWLSRHSWLATEQGFQLASKVSAAIGLETPVAKRPEKIQIAAHAKLQSSGGEYHIHGQLFNPESVPLAAPSIVVIQLDRDNRAIQTLTFQATRWQAHPSNHIAASQLMDFQLPISNWPQSSWGYQLQLAD